MTAETQAPGPDGNGGQDLVSVHGPEDFARAFGVSRETCDRLEIYADRLRAWQRAINLVSPSTIGHIWQRHFADSAQVLAYATDSRNWLDLGSGAGFPGMVIAIMLEGENERSIQLVESNGKKCAFLRQVARETGTSVEIIEARIETLGEKPTVGKVDVVTARALSPLDRLLDYAVPFFANNTRALFLKGREAKSELAAAAEHWQFSSRLHPSRTDAEGRIVEIWNLDSGI